MIDFRELVEAEGKRSMYYRYPEGREEEWGERWRCYCGVENEMRRRGGEVVERQKCVGCGGTLRLQESYEGKGHVTMSLVWHFGGEDRMGGG